MKLPIVKVNLNGNSAYGYADYFCTGSLVGNSFGISHGYGCREEFYKYDLSHKIGQNNYWFLLNIGSKGSVIEYRRFIRKAEQSMKIKNTIFIKKTDKPNCVMIGLNSWWLKSKIRLQFVTCLIRCYNHYYKKGGQAFDIKNVPLDKIIYSYDYLAQTKAATARFLEGYTLLKKGFKCEGWLNRFSGSKTNPEKCFVKIDAGEPDSNVPVEFNPADQLAGATVLS